MAEKIEVLGNGISAVLNDIHTFGTDAFLLYDFANIKLKETACDLCSGCGIIPLLMLRQPLKNAVTAVEIQEDACALMKKAKVMSDLGERLNIINTDLKKIDKIIPAGSYDLVTVNPPYFQLGSGFDCEDEPHRIIRSEVMCTLSDIIEKSAWLLRSGGRLCICHKPERLVDILCLMRANKIEPKRLKFVCKNEKSAPWLVLVEGKKDAKPSLIAEKNLYMNDEKELERIYSGYAER